MLGVDRVVDRRSYAMLARTFSVPATMFYKFSAPRSALRPKRVTLRATQGFAPTGVRELIHQEVGPNEKIKRGQIKLTESTMELEFCLEALRGALRRGRPEIFNSDQGSQFTSERFLGELEGRNIAISMDGRGRCLDNIFIERLWRSLKYEEVYLRGYQFVSEARTGIEKYFQFYNHERLHQSLDYQTPAAMYFGKGPCA
jgi:hypothetical protein